MSQQSGPIETRLRDASSAEPSLDRAAALIRAVPPPKPLDPTADARVRAALARAPERGLRAPRRLLPVFTLLGVVGTGFAAAAALRWMQPPPASGAISAESPAVLAVHAAAAQVEVAPPSDPAPPEEKPRAARPGRAHEFVRARLAIDPRDHRHRPEIPADFARLHGGEAFSWRVQICVSPAGDVQSATLLDRAHPALDRQVVRAIATWKYLPARQDGRAVHTCAVLAYELALEAED